jgi:HEAT repeat protein
MKRKLITACVLGAMLWAVAAAAQQVTQPAGPPIPAISTLDAGQVRQVELLLSGYHAIPTLAQLQAASPRAEDITAALVRDHATSPFIRPRAISALVTYWPNARSLTLVRQLVADPKTRDVTRHQLLLALPAFGEQVIPDLIPFLSHADLQLRLTAVEAMGKLTDHDAAVRALHTAHDAEPSKLVRGRIQRAARAVR